MNSKCWSDGSILIIIVVDYFDVIFFFKFGQIETKTVVVGLSTFQSTSKIVNWIDYGWK